MLGIEVSDQPPASAQSDGEVFYVFFSLCASVGLRRPIIVESLLYLYL